MCSLWLSLPDIINNNIRHVTLNMLKTTKRTSTKQVNYNRAIFIINNNRIAFLLYKTVPH